MCTNVGHRKIKLNSKEDSFYAFIFNSVKLSFMNKQQTIFQLSGSKKVYQKHSDCLSSPTKLSNLTMSIMYRWFNECAHFPNVFSTVFYQISKNHLQIETMTIPLTVPTLSFSFYNLSLRYRQIETYCCNSRSS